MTDDRVSCDSAGAASRFVQLSLRSRLDPRVLNEVHRLAEDSSVDWPAVVELVRAERVGPLLYHALRGRGILPHGFEAMLEGVYDATSKRNLSLLHELAQTLTLLSSAGLEIIVLKGAALIETVYRHVGLRPLRDVDVLVRQKDAHRAIGVLEAAGFVLEATEPRPGAAVDYENEVRLRKTGRVELNLELHWSLFDSPFYQHRLSLDWFHKTARREQIRGVPGLVLGPEAQLLHLCGHLSLHHRSEGLLWLHDLAELLAACGSEMDWDQVLEKAQENELVLPLQRVLPCVVSEWNVGIPARMLDQLRSLVPSSDELWAARRAADPDRSVVARFRDDIAGFPVWRLRLRFVWTSMFPSLAYMRERYAIRSTSMVPLYYPYRWMRGLRHAWRPPSLHGRDRISHVAE